MNGLNSRILSGGDLAQALPRLTEWSEQLGRGHPAHHPLWLYVLREGMGHTPLVLESYRNQETTGILPLALVKSSLFGRFLVSLPYLNVGGVLSNDPESRAILVQEGVKLSHSLNSRHLELRHETPVLHESLNGTRSNKVHMRLSLPDFPGPLWEELSPKVRNQVRKGERSGLTCHWGTTELLDEFYFVFARNMRDLGTPVYSKRLFAAIIHYFPSDAEFCLVRHQGKPVGGALLVHGSQVTEVPSASCLREYNPLSPNMLLYWNLIDRAIQREQRVFDFGRATKDGNTYKFKKQWGAEESPAIWQYHLKGTAADLRTDNPKYGRMIQLWKRLPMPIANFLGPKIVRGIP
ncbi:MAG: FemAB family PEP-CTERM system-associated protein [Gemmataceae bacterium]|jgi:FemAB-related protein (PEP-CTERM system-associated)|nr:FemAB family PEP-CTERM system-associated protein [Gemmataceae bacterium]